jgi:hypothetical protein
VADKIRKVENGADEFRNYLERRGDNATTAQQSGRAATLTEETAAPDGSVTRPVTVARKSCEDTTKAVAMNTQIATCFIPNP